MALSHTVLYDITNKLLKLSDKKLSEINTFVDFMLVKEAARKPEIKQLRGIWKGLGFEKVKNLKGELKSIRKEMTASILKKADKWNI